MNTANPLLSLSPCGRRFILRCPHCGINREEPVDPTRNPYPFSYLSNCSSCHTRLIVDHQQIAGIQHSYARAKGVTPFGAIPAAATAPVKGITTAVSQQAGNTSATRVAPAIDGAEAPIADAEKIPATVAMAGNEGGESQCTGSPAYSAFEAPRADTGKENALPTIRPHAPHSGASRVASHHPDADKDRGAAHAV